jgi:hypothetical protein
MSSGSIRGSGRSPSLPGRSSPPTDAPGKTAPGPGLAKPPDSTKEDWMQIGPA